MTLEYNLAAGVAMNIAHVYIGCDKYPVKNNGSLTVAPGQYTLISDSLDYASNYTVGPIEVSGSVWVIAHAVVCQETCRCSVSQDEGGSYTDSDISIECNSIPPVTEGTTFNAYPVPFIDEITINYALDYDTDVVLEVYDSKGTLLERVVNTNYSKAKLEVIKINLERYGNQMLFVKLTTNRETYTKKLIATEPKRQHK